MERVFGTGSRTAELGRGHAAVRDAARSLLAALERFQHGRVHAGEELADSAHDFAHLLRRHFAEEELCAVFVRSATLPETTRRWVERTREQHRELDQRTRAVVVLVEAAVRPGAHGGAELDRSLRALVADVADHESAEERLLQRVVIDGVGGGALLA